MDENISSCPHEDQSPSPPPARREFGTHEALFAWLSWLGGYIFCRAFPVERGPIGAFALILLLYITATVLLIRKGRRPGALSIAAAASGIMVACTLLLSSGAMLQFFACAYGIVSWLYYVYSVCGNSIRVGFNDFIAADFFKALVMPLISMGLFFRGLFAGRAQKGGRFLLKVLAGVGIAFFPTLIVLALLSYDSQFSRLLDGLFDFDIVDIFSHLSSVTCGIPVAMYIFGAYVSAEDGRMKESLTAESCGKAAEKLRRAPLTSVLAAVLPILFLYVVFFISQWSYYVSGFTGVLPENFSYADYAREGFFQLCTVAVINLAILLALGIFMKRDKAGKILVFKLLSLIFSLFTLVLISTAIAKLVMYIDYYGLTPKRVYAAWFMAVLALVFILAAVKQFVPGLKLVALSMAVTVVMFAALGLSNPNALIARYNVDRYLDGSLSTLDSEAMGDLGIAAVPEMVLLMEALEEDGDRGEDYTSTVIFLNNMRVRLINEDGIFDMNLPWIRARKALGSIYLPGTDGTSVLR